jgi:hypothetical protein
MPILLRLPERRADARGCWPGDHLDIAVVSLRHCFQKPIPNTRLAAHLLKRFTQVVCRP